MDAQPPAEPAIVLTFLPAAPVDGEREAADPWAEYRLPCVAEMLLAFTWFDGGDLRAEGQSGEMDGMAYDGMDLQAMRLELPVELRVEVDEDGRARIGLAPPTQTTETTILPVFHRMTIAIERDGGHGD